MNKHLITCALLSTAALAVAATPGVAQTKSQPKPASSADEPEPEQIVVTARRTEERLQDVPISITVFSQQQLSNRNIVNSGDLVAYTPSLSANNRFGTENASFAIRGFVQDQNTSPSVGVYFADVIAPRVNGGTTQGNGAGPGSFFDLQNVQVLKGPQGTLFGRNTTGGSILLVPQKPTGKLEGYVEGSAGDYGLLRIQGAINVPIGETIRIRLSGDRNHRNGYLPNRSNGLNTAIIGPKAFGDVNYYALRGSIVIDLTPNLENYTIASYSHNDSNGSMPKAFCVVVAGAACVKPGAGVTPTGYRGAQLATQILATPGFYDVSNDAPGANEDIKTWQVINTTTWRASDTLTIKNIISYAQFRQKQSSDIYGDNGYDATTGYTHFAVSLLPQPGKYNAAESTFTEELQLQGRLGDRLNYTVGGYYEKSDPLNGFQSTYSPTYAACTDPFNLQCYDARGRATPNGAGGTLEGRIGSISNSRSKYWFEDVGLFAQATYKLFEPLSITGGFRYTWDKARGLGQSQKINFPAPNVPVFSCGAPVPQVTGGTSAQILADPTLCNFTRISKSNRPTWLIDLEYKPITDVMLYAKYSRGYRQGSINVSSYGLESWAPEKVDTYEIGAKTGFRGFVSGTFNITGFYNDFTNQQIAAGLLACSTISLPQCPFVPSSTSGIANAGKSTIKGIEIETSINLFKGFRVEGGYTYIDAKLKEITPPAIPVGFQTLSLQSVATENRLAYVPKQQYTVTGAYTLPLDPSLGRLTFALTFSHRGTTYGTSSSSVANQTLPKQNLLNANVNWNDVAQLPLDLSFFVTNLTKNKFYLATVGQSFGLDSYIPNQPRMFGVRARVRFGS